MKDHLRVFREKDQNWFANVSGDYNPLHMDARFAAQRFPGERVVHGVHALLWALDGYCQRNRGRVAGFEATFIKPILLGDELSVDLSVLPLRLVVRGEVMATIRLSVPSVSVQVGPQLAVIRDVPADRSGENLAGAVGAVASPDKGAELSASYPHLASATSPSFLQGLAACSKLIGMECPGLHSVLSGMTVRMDYPDAPVLSYRTLRHDLRFSRVEIAVAGAGLAGQVSAFSGNVQAQAATDDEIRALVTSGAYKGHTPLIIGSTGGLGKETARLLAAGGAVPVLGYRDAGLIADVVQDVSRLGEFKTIAFDVTDPKQGMTALSLAGWQGSQVYYLPSPRIFRRRVELYQQEDLLDFMKTFVNDFYETMCMLLEHPPKRSFTVFYPSTVALDDATPDLFEYRLAKLAGEQLCRRLMQKHHGLDIVIERLPRIETRQTQTFTRMPAQPAHAVMAPIVQGIQRRVAQA